MLTVVVVDDDENMRRLIRLVLELESIEVVGEAWSAASALCMWRLHRPEIVVMDHRMPDGSGLDAARLILEEHPVQVIVMFSASMADRDVVEARRIGVRECLYKDELRRLPDMLRSHATG